MISSIHSNIGGWVQYILASCAFLMILYFGQTLFIPMSYGLLIAIVMVQPSRWLEGKGCHRYLAILLCLAVVVLLFAALLLSLGLQLVAFREEIPVIYSKLRPLTASFSKWLAENWLLPQSVQKAWLERTLQSSSDHITDWLQFTVSKLTSTLFSLFLVPIYAALFLYHRNVFTQFLYQLLPGKKIIIASVLQELVTTYHRYIKGMILVYLIVGLLNSIGLLALGIKHAILFGILTAIMTIIPYVGIFVSAALPVSIAFIATGEPWVPLGVVAVFSFVQYLEGNIIFPKVVGTQLNVSTWATLVAIIAGGILWGVSGSHCTYCYQEMKYSDFMFCYV